MVGEISRKDALNHEAAWDLLPWLVNGSLSGSEREQVEAHLRDCLTCRREIQVQKNLHRLVRQAATIPVSPQKGYEALMREVDVREQPSMLPAWIADLVKRNRSRLPSPRMVAVTTFGLAGLVLAILALPPDPLTGTARAPEYRTLTGDSSGEASIISIVFSGQATERDVARLVDQVDGQVLTGPTAAGEYIVRLAGRDLSETQLREKIQQLVADQRVESVQRTRLQSGQP
jgi:anti-sigma factor RsiW